jgi:trans-aconitate methyltransferase
VSNFWTNFTESYSTFDSFTQTFYYTLIHMLELDKAKHVLEVACGTCRLLPLTVSLKAPETTYLATDLTQSMVDMAQKRLKTNLEKAGVSASVEEWTKKNNITIRAANGEEPIEAPYKFDRMIANLVLMATEDPLKMLKNLNSMAEDGCLLGVTIWGNKELSNFMTLIPQAMKAKGLMQGPPPRSPFHLYGKLPELAEQSGWEIILEW